MDNSPNYNENNQTKKNTNDGLKVQKQYFPKCFNCNKIGYFSVATAGSPLCGECAREYINGL